MRRGLAISGLILAGLLLVAYAYRDPLSFAWLQRRIQPPVPFDASPAPEPPDYANPDHWAALPDREDEADGAPRGADPDAQATALADVFFVHPTTYYRARAWNQPLDDAEVNRFTDEVVIRGAASVFNACCRVYAPRYRQAALGVLPLFDQSGDGDRALDLAYRDVEAAFDYFLEHLSRGRPFVLAAHSQGSLHGRWLLERRIAGTPLADRLVAAYLIGYGVRRGELAASVPDIPVCDTPEALSCVVVWNAVGPDAAELEDTTDFVCVNPLTGRTDGEPAPRTANAGAVFFDAQVPLPFDTTPLETRLAGLLARAAPQPPPAEPLVEPEAADAQCVGGRLVVREIRSARFRAAPVWGDNYHAYDYTLFWMNLRRDAVRRVTAALARG